MGSLVIQLRVLELIQILTILSAKLRYRSLSAVLQVPQLHSAT